jgi:hypothetical protein
MSYSIIGAAVEQSRLVESGGCDIRRLQNAIKEACVRSE